MRLLFSCACTKTDRKLCKFQQIPITRGPVSHRGEMQIYTDTIFRKLNSAYRVSLSAISVSQKFRFMSLTKLT